MAFQATKIIRIIPDQIGRGGSKTSLTSQSINLDLRLAQNVFVTYGRWRRAGAPILATDFPAIAGSLQSYALHNFARFDTTNAALGPINRLLSHNLVGGAQQINQHNPIALIKSHIPPGVLDTVPATFLNITNRCFICWGATNNFIYTGAQTYDVGVDAPATAATYTFGGVNTGTLFATAGGFIVTFTTGTSTWNNNIKFITIGGVQYPTKQPNPFSSGPYPVGGTLTGTAGSNDVVINGFNFPDRDYNGLFINFTDDLALPETHYVLRYTISGANTNVHLDTPLTNNATAVAYTLSGDQLTLGTAYTGETTSSVIFTTFEGPLRWTTSPPQYAYAYYDSPFMDEGGLASGTIGTHAIQIAGSNPASTDALWGPDRYVGVKITIGGDTYTVQSYGPGGANITNVATVEVLANTYTNAAYVLSGTLAAYGTGHISNASPATMVTEQNQGGVSVVLSNIIPSRLEDQPRFNRIQLFRTSLTGGGVYSPLDHTLNLLNNVGTAPLSFTDTFDDTLYLVFAGFEFPQTKNRKPPPFAHQAYWNGRVWGNPVDDPSAVVFSADVVQVTFGVPSECYPSSNILRIPADDGRVTGMALMGPLLVISTERYSYYVTGSNENDYALARFATMMMGVGDKQMVEFAGATTDDSDLLLYVGKDKKFYLTAPSVGNISISDPVQDQFNSGIGTNYAGIRVANVAINGNHYLIVNHAGVGGNAAAYDWDRKVWTSQYATPAGGGAVGMEAFAIIYGTSVPVQFLFIYHGTVYEWLGDSNTTGQQSAFVQTMPLMGDRKSRQRLQFVRAYVSNMPDPPNTWVCGVSVNEQFPTNFFFVPYTVAAGFDPLDTMQPPGSFPIDSANAREIVLTAPMMQAQIPIEGYRFQIMIAWPGGTTPGLEELYAIDIGYTDLEPPDQASL